MSGKALLPVQLIIAVQLFLIQPVRLEISKQDFIPHAGHLNRAHTYSERRQHDDRYDDKRKMLQSDAYMPSVQSRSRYFDHGVMRDTVSGRNGVFDNEIHSRIHSTHSEKEIGALQNINNHDYSGQLKVRNEDSTANHGLV
jgi:hypothetical protein